MEMSWILAHPGGMVNSGPPREIPTRLHPCLYGWSVQFGCGPFFLILRQPIHPEPFPETSGIAGHQQIPDDTIIIAQNFRHGMLRCMIGTYKQIPQGQNKKPPRTYATSPRGLQTNIMGSFKVFFLCLPVALHGKDLGTHDPDQG